MLHWKLATKRIYCGHRGTTLAILSSILVCSTIRAVQVNVSSRYKLALLISHIDKHPKKSIFCFRHNHQVTRLYYFAAGVSLRLFDDWIWQFYSLFCLLKSQLTYQVSPLRLSQSTAFRDSSEQGSKFSGGVKTSLSIFGSCPEASSIADQSVSFSLQIDGIRAHCVLPHRDCS